ncbi:MAG: DSBA oxidoreductase [Candidatus Tokpelaia hoelldobleri]|uniref:DSBA oxidoreductase n=1 Tax=Candidatus Tokpelaia hoelldobleri TaxID=1902579 RepID=A0A1U9JU51_9HYPH|nr:MAG: DSBA oxidoreductase [Candidatus Tokpelaia hoelldoblerii]
MPQKNLPVDVIIDLICPWCFLGFRRLLQTQAMLDEVTLSLAFKPYLLNPDIPAAGRPYQAYLRQKLGEAEQITATHDMLKKLGAEAEIEFDFDAIKTMPNTLDTHRLVYWAGQAEAGTQTHVVEELFSRFFEQGQNIADHTVLVDAAQTSGMRADVVAKLLQTDIDRQTIRDDAALAQKIGVRGVPCYIVDKKYAIMGAESSKMLADTLRQIANGFAPVQAEDR